MLNVNVDHIGDLAIVECEGRIVQSDAAFRLREAITAQRDARTVVLDLSEVSAIEGGGLGMLVCLQRWAQDHDIRFKLFNPSKFVRDRLKKASSMSEFDIPTLDEMMSLLARADRRYALAA
jgi:anti-anti-sigma regulatory factor